MVDLRLTIFSDMFRFFLNVPHFSGLWLIYWGRKQTISMTERTPQDDETPLMSYWCAPQLPARSQTNHRPLTVLRSLRIMFCSRVGVLQDEKTPPLQSAEQGLRSDVILLISLLCFSARCDPSTLSLTNHSALRIMFVPDGERLVQDDESAEQRRPCEPAAVYRGRPSCFLLYCTVTLMNIIEGINRFIIWYQPIHLCFSTNVSSFHPTLLFDEYHTDHEYNQGDWPSLCSILNKEKDLHPTRGFKDT